MHLAAYTANGRLGAMLNRTRLWDIAARMLVVQEMGRLYTDLVGQCLDLDISPTAAEREYEWRTSLALSSPMAMSIESLCTSIPTNNLLDLLMACLLFSVDTLVFNVWLWVVRHVIHDTKAAVLLNSAASHSV
jgi:hypothetical protein